MFNNHYGKQKDGLILEYDTFMTIGKDKKWDYDKIDDKTLRIFNPTNNDTILMVSLNEIISHFDYDYSIDINDCWDYMTEFVSSNLIQEICYYYNNLK